MLNPQLLRRSRLLRLGRIITPSGAVRTSSASLIAFYSARYFSPLHASSSSSFHSSAKSLKSNRNHYEQLGLSQSATKKEIKSRFYKLSKLHHPDKNSSEDSRKVFHAINEAYSVLGDDRQRRDYDLTLLDRSGQLYSSSPSSSRSPPTRGTLRTTRFRHSAQSARAAAEARTHAGSRAANFGGVGGAAGNFKGPVAHFDSKSHQEMHYEQDIRREERRQERERNSKEYRYQQAFEESDTMTSKLFRVAFIFMTIFLASSAMRVFADEKDGGGDMFKDEDQDEGNVEGPCPASSEIATESEALSVTESSTLSSLSSSLRIPPLNS
ncbi:hypothetical protein BGZ83_010883 [Gryganskiella cystojenkinii]|nr:hypothetical protein BGZ83_010883 [Gryganskiella cystojenkinii]